MFAGSRLVGAVGVDFSLSELFADDLVTESLDSYFFVVETQDFIVETHPLISNPVDVRSLLIGQCKERYDRSRHIHRQLSVPI